MIEIVEPAPVALSKTEWNAVRRCAETAVARRDHGLALALGNAVPLCGSTGLRGGSPARSPTCKSQPGAAFSSFDGQRTQTSRGPSCPGSARTTRCLFHTSRIIWLNTGKSGQGVRGEAVASWSRWPDGHLFLGQRGPLAERGIREIIAKLGQAAKLFATLGPHDLRHTFAKSLLDPAAYGLDRPPMPLPAIQQLLGHADIATTTIYTRVSNDDLARMMGTSEAL